MKEPKIVEKAHPTWPWFVALIFCLIFFLAYYFFVTHFFGTPKGTAEFGDAFGGLTALVTSFAFVGLLWTISLQSFDIGIQREELRESRLVLNEQKEALIAQRDLQRLQAFEATFFRLLGSYDKLVHSLFVRGSSSVHGREELANWLAEYRENIQMRIQKLNTPPHALALQDQDRIECFKNVFENKQIDPTPIFQTLHRVLEFTSEAPSLRNREFYVDILAAHMSLAEKWFLYMWPNCYPNFESVIKQLHETRVLRTMPSHVLGLQLRFDNSPIAHGIT